MDIDCYATRCAVLESIQTEGYQPKLNALVICAQVQLLQRCQDSYAMPAAQAYIV